MEKHDVFNILGISNREDSYIDLVKYLFDNWSYFKIRFCNMIAGANVDDFILETRKTINVPGGKNNIRKKIAPDMILYSKKQNLITLIESKIYAEEGYRQTDDYSESESIINQSLELPTASFQNHKYITLDGDTPSSTSFFPLKWANVIFECCKDYDNISDSRTKLLVGDLYTRASEYSSLQQPKEDESYADYMRNRKRWITPFRLNKKFMEALCKDFLLDKKYSFESTYSHNMSGRQYLYIISKNSWQNGDINDETKVNLNNYNIHIESNWLEGYDWIKTAVHFETNPYITQNKLNKKSAELQNNYRSLRQTFKECFNNKIQNIDWKVQNYDLSIAVCYQETKISFADYKHWYEKQVGSIITIIDETINEILL